MGYYCVRNQLAVEPEVVTSPGGPIHSSESRLLLPALSYSDYQSADIIARVHNLPALEQCGVCLAWCVRREDDTDMPSVVQV